jgi:hypothetical protein
MMALPNCRNGSGGLLSLWDLMNKFEAHDVCMTVRNFTWLKDSFHHYAGKQPSGDLASTTQSFAQNLSFAIKYCAAAGFTDAATTLRRITLAVSSGRLEPARLTGEAWAAENAILDDIKKLKYVYVPSEMVKFFEQERLFGEPVHAKFPHARSDIKEAGNCLSLGRGTAAVFHLMRAAEHGLRGLARKVKADLRHNGKVVPIEFADWNKVITQTKNKITEIRRLNPGPIRDRNLEFYSDMAEQAEYIKDIWRNTISHTRRPFSVAEAVGVTERVEGFMQKLATDLRRMR